MIYGPAAQEWQPSDYGLITWAFDPAEGTATSTPLATAGVMTMIGLLLRTAQLVTNIVAFVVTAGATLTANECFASLYSPGGTLLGQSADQSGNWVSTGQQVMPLAGGPVVAGPGLCRVSYLFNGTTGPAMARANSSAFTNIGLPAGGLRFATSGSGLTAPPSQLGAMSASGTAYWAGLS